MEQHAKEVYPWPCPLFPWWNVLHHLIWYLQHREKCKCTCCKVGERIEIIGPHIVVGFVANGEATNWAARAILEGMYPHMTLSFWMAHGLNNLLKDIEKLPWIHLILEDANLMVTFVLNHTFLCHEFSKKIQTYSPQVLKHLLCLQLLDTRQLDRV